MSFPSLSAGDVFAGHYRIAGPLGEGEISRAYVAEHAVTGTSCVLEVFDVYVPVDAEATFLRPIHSAARVEDAYLDPVIDAGVAEGTPWVARTRRSGEGLTARLERGEPLPQGEASAILDHVGRALAAAHAAGVVHGDLRPEHVFLAARPGEAQPRALLGGLAVGRLVGQWELAEPVAAKQRWSWQWSAPEVIRGGHGAMLSPRADVWSYGLFAFRLLTGERFWEGIAVGEVLREAIGQPIPRASARAAGRGAEGRLPSGFDAWFARCVTREPADRFADAESARIALAALFLPPPPVPMPILANPKGSFYDDGLAGAGSGPPLLEVDGPGGPYRSGKQKVRPPEDFVVLANPKGSFYDRGLAQPPRRWPMVVGIALVIAAAVAAAIHVFRR